MRFGAVALDQAEGGLLAYSLTVGSRRLKKGHALTAEDVADLARAGLTQVTIARLDPGDVPENAAALRLARALVPVPEAAGLRLDPAFTGRVNIRATGPGIVDLNVADIHALNRIDPMVTLATLPPLARVSEGSMVGTVKIISYAVSEAALSAACAAGAGAMRRIAPVLRSAGLIVTHVADAPQKPDAKGIAAVRGRLEALGVTLDRVVHVAHEAEAIAAALAGLDTGLALVLTGSATSDAADVAPMGMRRAGGRLIRFGMPVDPGNLLFLGEIGARPVIGLPGCARSPALNGADWVLERVICGYPVTDADIAAMGVGGLLKEIPSRPQPRDGPKPR
ncbi:Molybdopterin biosynthesis enzyme [Roseibacterium elongatum DSM 19469]|uniref:Molybdopterin biosynthesis enzyme n=1 Tax=Roseicyclus elongatus DSM 19469 TaxID=1294273 RepID=W8RUF5_9RHOB|nr:molybdopterin-binding protein [Roseibacterium elongatum]AHM04844.1 Molybdopterin biosynthesis enzyme [Roseibacterium elongatum DSM 19469]